MIGAIGFAVEGLAAAVLVLVSYRQHQRFATFGELLDRVMTTRAARLCLLMFWWWLGWQVFLSQTVDPPLH